MASRRSFKSDESFLKKIAMGAIGTQQVFHDLEVQGHTPIELERGSMSFKIWKTIKIKRIRVPDILCIKCGNRVESRAKSALEISMSHSTSDLERSWDHGLESDDYVAFVQCTFEGPSPVDWKASELVQYVQVGEMRAADAAGLTRLSQPKGAEEGFENRISWPVCIASASGRVEKISDEMLIFRRTGATRTSQLKLFRKVSDRQVRLTPIVDAGDEVSAGQIVAAVVPVKAAVPCSHLVSPDTYISLLFSSSLSDRYTAAKALYYLRSEDTADALITSVADTKNHLYVRLEAAASLARWGYKQGKAFIASCLEDHPTSRLEAVIVLSEIGGDWAEHLLTQVLQDEGQPTEVRAGSAWALGELQNQQSIDVLITSFNNLETEIRVEAARAIAKLAANFTDDILRLFPSGNVEERPGIAWALSKSAKFSIDQLLATLVDDDARRWIAYVIGTQRPERYTHEIEAVRLQDPELYFAVTVLWQILNSWIYGMELHG